MFTRERTVVDAIDHGKVGIGSWRRDQHRACARLQVSRRLLPRREDAGAFQRHVDAEIGPRQPCGIALAEDLDRPRAHVDSAVRHLDRAGEAPVDRIVAQQVRVGLHVAQVVEGDDGKIGAAGFVNCAQDVAADPPEAVDGDANRHGPSND